MGQEKERRLIADEAWEAAAKRAGRTCPYCGTVIPYGVEPGPNGECPACVGALKDGD